jgi:NADH-quinone oxidoreductase subunit G
MDTGLTHGLGFRTSEQVWAELMQVGPWDGERPTMASRPAPETPIADGDLVLASWKQLLDDGRMQDGDDAMRRTARKPVVLVGPATLAALGASVGELVTLTGPLGSIDLPIAVGDLADGTVWAPASAPDASVRHRVGPAGSPVSITTIVGGGR